MASDGNGNVGSADLAVIALELLAGPVAVLVCRADWTIAWANASATELLGGDPRQQPLSDILHGEPDSLAGSTGERALRQFRRPEGKSPFWAFTRTSDTASGHVLQIFEADDYVREREKLAYQESIFRNAIEAAEHGVWEYNANNEALYYSDAWKAMRGFPLDGEFHDTNELWEARLHPDDLKSVREHVRQSNSGEIDHFSFEYRERHVDGRWIWILARGRSVEWDESGRPTRLIGTDIDITKLKDEEARRAAEAGLTYQKHLAELETANRATEAARQAAFALARQDPLSSLANRRGFAEEIARLSNDARAAPAFAVLLIDLDRFKPVNDMHGHAVGDLVIKESAQRLAAAVAP